MKVVTLMENSALSDEFIFEHGLSLYIETQNRRILFDSGQSGAFADNAEKMGIDLSRVDFAVLSHGHYDHGGGLGRFMEINRTAPIYINRSAVMPHYNAKGRYIGLDTEVMKSDRFVFVDDYFEICDGITLHSCNNRNKLHLIDSAGQWVLENEVMISEDFRHEQYLIVQESGRCICFSGCSHKGILNVQHWFSPDVLVGGFHYMKQDERQFLLNAARELMDYPAVYYTGHCTGEWQFEVMKTVMGERLYRLRSGTVEDI